VSELEAIEDSIRNSLRTITTHWDALTVLPSTKIPGAARGSKPSRGVPAHDPVTDPLGKMVADDHAPDDSDIDRVTRMVSLRRSATDVLNGWSRVVMEDRPVTRALPDGRSVLSMAQFLDRHAQWVSWSDAATDCQNELADIARQVQAMAAPKRRDYVYLGDCPFVVEDWFCNGRIRSRIGGDEEATCSDCGQTAVIGWWEQVLGITQPEPIVGAVAMAKILHERLHVTITERTVRNWARDGRVAAFIPFGPQPREPRWWFEPRTVLDEVARMNRECPTCGRDLQGFGEVCGPCYTKIQDARPVQAEPKRHTPAPIQLFPRRVVVPDSHDTDRPTRCHYSDLPVNQCACGHGHLMSMEEVAAG
jgi:hypothetical protein